MFNKFMIPLPWLQIKVYMGEGWNSEFGLSHFDFYSPPDLYVQVRTSRNGR